MFASVVNLMKGQLHDFGDFYVFLSIPQLPSLTHMDIDTHMYTHLQTPGTA